MNIKLSLSVFLIGISLNLFSQDFKKPDYDEIKINIINEESDFYYPQLLNRLKQLDTTLTSIDFEHLYYGYIFNKDYNPYSETSQEEKLSKILESNEELTKNDYSKYIKLANQSLEEFPIDIRLMNMLAYFYKLDGQEAKFNSLSIIFQNFVRTILSSGDGSTCESAFHVISVSHEYVFLMMFGLENISQSLSGNCDYMEFEKDRYQVDGLYFDISKLQAKNLEILESK